MNFVEGKQELLSTWGTLATQWGINRTMAQIHALLLISPEPLSAEEIMEELSISRGNANMNIRELMSWDLVKKILKPDGTFIIEIQYLINTLLDCTFDNIYHEHVNYWSVLSLNNFFNKQDAKLFKVEKINTHGGSIRVFITKDKNKKTDKSVQDFLNKEKELGLDKFKIYEEFSKKVDQIKNNVKKNITNLKSKKKTIVGYGSPAKATTALNFYNISKEISHVII